MSVNKNKIMRIFRELLKHKSDTLIILYFVFLHFADIVFGHQNKSYRLLYRVFHDYDHRKYKFAKFAMVNDKISLSRDFQDLLVLFLNQHSKTASHYIEFGAADGCFKSNCAALEKVGWTGIAIEPNPEFLYKLHNNRSCLIIPKAISINNTLSTVLYYDAKQPSSGTIVPSKQNKSNLASQVTISTITPTELLALYFNHFSEQPKYISLDIEGNEEIILESILKEIKPNWISVEHNFERIKMNSIKTIAHHFQYEIIFENLTRNEFFLERSEITF